MKRILFPLLCLGSSLLSQLGAATPAAPVRFDWFEYTGKDAAFSHPLPAGHFQNPILAGFYPDPSICRVGDDYYLINSTFAYFPGIPIFHSRDLVNWTQLGHVITRPDQLNYEKLGVSRAIFAPAISHHNGTFYVVCTMVDAGGNFVMTAKDPAGPWSDPVWFDFEGIDPSLFFDEDGRAWMVNNGAPEGTPLYSGHRAIWIQEFDPVALRMVGPRTLIINGGVDLSKKPVWIEGPHIYRKDGAYFLSCAEGGTSLEHSQVVFRAENLLGPWIPWDQNPILTQRDLDPTAPQAVTSTGHADLVEGPDGNWWAVFLACRPFSGANHYATGRETFLLPVDWPQGGWPRILSAGKRVPYQVRAPKGVSIDQAQATPWTGNFTWRDDFDAAALSSLWITLRAPKQPWWDLTAAPGHLVLTPRADALSGTGTPSFLARRLQHSTFSATLALTPPTSAGVASGLALFQGEKHHFFAGVRRHGEGLQLFVERLHGAGPETIAKVALPPTDGLLLRIEGKGEELTFSHATSPVPAKTSATGAIDSSAPAPAAAASSTTWSRLATADARIISTETAGGFVGATVGPHARLEKP